MEKWSIRSYTSQTNEHMLSSRRPCAVNRTHLCTFLCTFVKISIDANNMEKFANSTSSGKTVRCVLKQQNSSRNTSSFAFSNSKRRMRFCARADTFVHALTDREPSTDMHFVVNCPIVESLCARRAAFNYFVGIIRFHARIAI